MGTGPCAAACLLPFTVCRTYSNVTDRLSYSVAYPGPVSLCRVLVFRAPLRGPGLGSCPAACPACLPCPRGWMDPLPKLANATTCDPV